MNMSYGKCTECKKFGTVKCPPSSECMSVNERPFFEPKKETKKWWMKFLSLFKF